jgi:hypothetical protein
MQVPLNSTPKFNGKSTANLPNLDPGTEGTHLEINRGRTRPGVPRKEAAPP